MVQRAKDLVDVKTILAAEYEDWAEYHDYPVDYDDLGDLLDGMIRELCSHVKELQSLPAEIYDDNDKHITVQCRDEDKAHELLNALQYTSERIQIAL